MIQVALGMTTSAERRGWGVDRWFSEVRSALRRADGHAESTVWHRWNVAPYRYSRAARLLLVLYLWLGVIPFAKSQNVLTWHNDAARTGQNLNETGLTTSNVNSNSFGKLFVIPVDGKVDAQPLYVSGAAIPAKGTHNLLIVATEHNSLYAFDADTGAQLWHVSLLLSGEMPSDDRGCGQ